MIGLAVLLAIWMSGCGARLALMPDESERIAEVMRSEPYREDLPGALGSSLGGAQTTSPARLTSPRYELRTGRSLRIGGARGRLAPRARQRTGALREDGSAR